MWGRGLEGCGQTWAGRTSMDGASWLAWTCWEEGTVPVLHVSLTLYVSSILYNFKKIELISEQLVWLICLAL